MFRFIYSCFLAPLVDQLPSWWLPYGIYSGKQSEMYGVSHKTSLEPEWASRIQPVTVWCCSTERPRMKCRFMTSHQFMWDVKQDWRHPSPQADELNVRLSAAKVAIIVTCRKIMFVLVCEQLATKSATLPVLHLSFNNEEMWLDCVSPWTTEQCFLNSGVSACLILMETLVCRGHKVTRAAIKT